MENHKEFIEEKVVILPQLYLCGSFIRYEDCLTACEMATNEAKNNSTNPPDFSYIKEIEERIVYRLQQEFPDKKDMLKEMIGSHFENIFTKLKK